MDQRRSCRSTLRTTHCRRYLRDFEPRQNSRSQVATDKHSPARTDGSINHAMPDIHNYCEGWSVAELFGHGKAIGFVTTEYFGTACIFRCYTPERAAREYLLEKPSYGRHPETMAEMLLPAGTKVK